MKKISILLAFGLMGCQDFSFGFFGNQPTTPPNQTTNSLPTKPSPYGELIMCINDSHCPNNLVCYKNDPNNYSGICAEIK